MYDSIYHSSMGLTKIHICLHSLRDSDGEHYQQLRNKWFTIDGEVIKKRKLMQERYRKNRKQRLDRDFGSACDVSDTETDNDAETQAP